MTYLGHHVTLTWGQILTLTFQGHAIHVSMRLDEANTMVSKSLLYHFKHGSYHWKTVFAQKCRFWPSVTSDAYTVSLRWNLTAPQRKSVSRAFYCFFKFWCSCYRERDNAHNMKPCHVIRKFGENFALDDLWWPQFWPHIKMTLVLSLELVKTYRVLFSACRCVA